VRFDFVGEEDLRHSIQLDQSLPVFSHLVLLRLRGYFSLMRSYAS
jgi:hypothetical protein